MSPQQKKAAQDTGARIRKAREKRGWTALQLAEMSGLSQSFISKVENGKTAMRDAVKWKLVGALAVPYEALFVSTSNVEVMSHHFRSVPLLDYVQAGRWSAVNEGLSEDDIREMVAVDIDCPPSTFALRVRGDSMLPEFREGDVLIVNPTISARPGNYVIAKEVVSGEATFKQYRDGGLNAKGKHFFELVPLNENYARQRSDQQQLAVVGVVVRYYRNLVA